MKENYVKTYDWSIVIIKFVATFFVLNSHMGICYPNYSFLATGGGIGNALFFFVSGFTLFFAKHTNFPNYYKRRISRIYPAVIAMALLACLIWNSQSNFAEALTNAWFINCIMLYYILLWICRNLKINLIYVIIFSTIIGVGVLLFFNDFTKGIIYGNKSLRYFIYFPFMVFGAYLGVHREKISFKKQHFFLMLLSFVTWYMFNSFKNELQVGSVLVLFPFLYYLYTCGNSKFIQKLLSNRIAKSIIVFCGGLCLEVYLIQFHLITDKFNNIFPLNIPLVFIIVISCAYFLHIMAQIILQTFRNTPYSFKEMVKI